MSKPIRKIKVTTMDGKKAAVEALIDTGSFYTIIREDCVPPGAKVIKYRTVEKLGTAKKSGQVRIVASAEMILDVEGHPDYAQFAFPAKHTMSIDGYRVGTRRIRYGQLGLSVVRNGHALILQQSLVHPQKRTAYREHFCDVCPRCSDGNQWLCQEV